MESGGTPLGSRWNPTKEQISMLEELYMQGVRTPSAEDIQKITTQLKAFGHIEGKNVFYWFQNHKARQRQRLKQRQESFFDPYKCKDGFAQYRVFNPNYAASTISLNVICGQYYHFPGSELFYSQQPPPPPAKRFIPAGINSNNSKTNHDFPAETLPLFPLHPTGISQGLKDSTAGCRDYCPGYQNSDGANEDKKNFLKFF